jgi:hypothetical protein
LVFGGGEGHVQIERLPVLATANTRKLLRSHALRMNARPNRHSSLKKKKLKK